jgi:hypothetical protein
MEFLDVNLSKDLSLLSHAVLTEAILYSGFKNPYKKNRLNKKTRERQHEPEKTWVYVQKTSTKIAVQEFYLCSVGEVSLYKEGNARGLQWADEWLRMGHLLFLHSIN